MYQKRARVLVGVASMIVVCAGWIVTSDSRADPKSEPPARGGKHNRTFHTTALDLKSKPTVLWTRKILKEEKHHILGTSATDGVIIIHGSILADTLLKPSRMFLMAISLVDGRELWKHNIPSDDASMAILKGRVIVTSRGAVMALDAASGKVIWKKKIGSGKPDGLVYLLARGKQVYLTMPGDKTRGRKAKVISVDPNGKKLWNSAIDLDGNVELAPNEKTVIAYSSRDSRVVALRINNGKRVWRAQLPPWPAQPQPKSVTAVAVVGTSSQRVVVSACARIIRTPPFGSYIAALDSRTGELLWRKSFGGLAGFVRADGMFAYVGVVDIGDKEKIDLMSIVCVELKSGKTRWTRPDVPKSFGLSVSGRTLLYAGRGNLYGFSTDDGKLIWKLELAKEGQAAALMGWRVVIAGKYLIVSDDRTVWILKPGILLHRP